MKVLNLILNIFLILFISCVRENNSTPSPEAKSNVVFQLSETDAVSLNTVDVLAFEVDPDDNSKEYFSYRSQAQTITDTADPNKKEVVVTLNTGGAKKYRFVVLCNVSKEIDALGEINNLSLKETILERLVRTSEGKWITDSADPNYTGFPMWGETDQLNLSSQTSAITGVYLLRMLARIDVSVAPNISEKFKLRSVRVYNFNSKGQVVPNTDPEHWDGQVALMPTIPANATKSVGPLVYDNISVDEASLRNEIFLFESSAVNVNEASKATCLVIGGEYNNEGRETFYRLDFVDIADGQVVKYWDLLRNYFYNVNISDVAGSGTETPDQAFNAQNVNITCEINAWEMGELSDIIVEGSYILRVNQNEFSLPMNQRQVQNQDNKFKVFTDYPAGWQVDRIVDENGDFIPVSWLTVNRYSGSANNETTISLLTDENSTEVDRTAYIHLIAGRIEYVVKVIQTTIPELGLHVTDSEGEEIGSLLFGSYIGSTVPSQTIDVTWVPVEADLSVSTITLVGKPEFNFGSGDRIDAEVIVGSNGLKTYSIQPPAMTQAEINANPFLEKALRVDFTVTNGVSRQSEVLFLTQRNYAAVPKAIQDYLMNGSEYSFIVNANAPWSLEVTDDPNNIIEELYTVQGGQYEDKRDETVFFKIVNNLDPLLFEAEVTFTLKSTNVDRPFLDKVFKVKGYSIIPRKRLLTIGSGANDFGYNFSGTAASNKLITTTRNYGVASTSFVKAEGFTIIDGGVNPSEAQILGWLITNPVDIVVIGFDNANISTNIANYYAQYLNNGGIVIAFQDRTDAAVSGNFLRAVLSNSGITINYATGAGSIYPFENQDIGVLQGPFGDIRGRQWGEDASTTVRVSGIDPATIDVLSGDRDISTSGSTATAGYVTGFKHKTLSLIWFGDGGFNSNNAANDLTICPFKIDVANYPIPKASYGRGAIRYPVYNSVFTANAMAWALKQAEINRVTR